MSHRREARQALYDVGIAAEICYVCMTPMAGCFVALIVLPVLGAPKGPSMLLKYYNLALACADLR
jgi:hypothetical protein